MSNLKIIQKQLNSAQSYEEWKQFAVEYDRLSGKVAWKLNPVDTNYDYQLLSQRLDLMRKARNNGNLPDMLFLLRLSLLRNLADMGTSALYNQTKIGTKKLVEDYIEEVLLQLQYILNYQMVDGDTSQFDIDAKLVFFQSIRQLQGRTALLLSGGAMMGLLHTGIIKSLIELKLLPKIISGSSAGSLMAALIGTKDDQEFLDFVKNQNFDLKAMESEDEEGNLFAKLNRLLKHGVLFDVEVLKKCVINNIGEMTFQEAYNKTRRILNITVSSSTKYEMPRLLNYLTAPNVLVWSAVAASCAIPFIYKGAPILARDRNGNTFVSDNLWIDGSVENDLPMTRLSEMFNVNHFIVCQVNPHIVPFLQNGIESQQSGYLMSLIKKGTSLILSEIQHRFKQLIELELFTTPLHHANNILSQKYQGDITIVPEYKLYDYYTLISNPSNDLLFDAIQRGQKAIWEKESIIRNHCQIELFIDECIHKLRIQKLEQDWLNKNLHVTDSMSQSQILDQSGKQRTTTLPTSFKYKKAQRQPKHDQQIQQFGTSLTISGDVSHKLQELLHETQLEYENLESSKSDDESSCYSPMPNFKIPISLQMSSVQQDSSQQQQGSLSEQQRRSPHNRQSKSVPTTPIDQLTQNYFAPEYDTSLETEGQDLLNSSLQGNFTLNYASKHSLSLQDIFQDRREVKKQGSDQSISQVAAHDISKSDQNLHKN